MTPQPTPAQMQAALLSKFTQEQLTAKLSEFHFHYDDPKHKNPIATTLTHLYYLHIGFGFKPI